MEDLINQLHKKLAIERIKNETLQQTLKDIDMLNSWKDVYTDVLINYFMTSEEDLFNALGEEYLYYYNEFFSLKEECRNLAKYSSLATTYIEKIENINLPSKMEANNFDDVMAFIGMDVHNALLNLLIIRRNLMEESKMRTIDSLF